MPAASIVNARFMNGLGAIVLLASIGMVWYRRAKRAGGWQRAPLSNDGVEAIASLGPGSAVSVSNSSARASKSGRRSQAELELAKEGHTHQGVGHARKGRGKEAPGGPRRPSSSAARHGKARDRQRGGSFMSLSKTGEAVVEDALIRFSWGRQHAEGHVALHTLQSVEQVLERLAQSATKVLATSIKPSMMRVEYTFRCASKVQQRVPVSRRTQIRDLRSAEVVFITEKE